MPTISGLRRRGYTAKSIKIFCNSIGVTKQDSVINIALLEHFLRDELNRTSKRVMAVIDPIKLVITNCPDDLIEELDAVNNPEDSSMGSRKVPFSKELYIERNDFMEDPPKKYFRLSPGREVRLRYGYYITCTDVVKDPDGNIIEIHCTYDPKTRGGSSPDGRRVKGTIHWVSARHCITGEVRLYDRLFTVPVPESNEEGKDYKEYINPDSLKIIKDARLEPSLENAEKGMNYQFERLGYFFLDSVDSTAESMVFNRTVTLRDTWGKISNP